MAGLLQAAAARLARTRSRSSPTSSRKPRWPTPSSSRCSSSSGRSGCRSSASRSPTSSTTRSRWPRATVPARRGAGRGGRCAERSAADPGRSAPAAAGVHEPADQRVRGAERRRRRPTSRRSRCRPTRKPAPRRCAGGADGPGRGHRRRAGHAAGRDGPDLQPVLHDQAAGLRARPGHRPQDRRRARRPHRRRARRQTAARASASRCRSAAATNCSSSDSDRRRRCGAA